MNRAETVATVGGGPGTANAPDIGELCAGFTGAYENCFKQWCALLGGNGRPDWAAVAESQLPLHEAAERLRAYCLASPAAAAAAEERRQALMIAQVEGELAAEAQLRGRHGAEFGQKVQQGWISARWAIICERDALTVGLGWPHRGEPVLVTTWYYDEDSKRVDLVAAGGLYSMGHDVFEVSHEVLVPTLGLGGTKCTRRCRQHCSVYVWWHGPGEPHLGPGRPGPPGPADPAGDIGLRLRGAADRRLPVPLQRWPEPADVGIAVAAAPPPPEALFDPDAEGVARSYASRAGLGGAADRPRRRPVPLDDSEETTLF